MLSIKDAIERQKRKLVRRLLREGEIKKEKFGSQILSRTFNILCIIAPKDSSKIRKAGIKSKWDGKKDH